MHRCRLCALSPGATLPPVRGPKGPVWGQAGWKGLVPSTSGSSEQRHGKATQPQSKTVCSAQGPWWWGNRRGRGVGVEGPAAAGPPGPRAAAAAHQPTPSISLALFSHSPTSRPPVNSSWLSTLTWAPPGSGEVFSGPEMIDGSISHQLMDLGLIAPFSTHGQALEASGGDSPSPGHDTGRQGRSQGSGQGCPMLGEPGARAHLPAAVSLLSGGDSGATERTGTGAASGVGTDTRGGG